jgi:hypothetical protein
MFSTSKSSMIRPCFCARTRRRFPEALADLGSAMRNPCWARASESNRFQHADVIGHRLAKLALEPVPRADHLPARKPVEVIALKLRLADSGKEIP